MFDPCQCMLNLGFLDIFLFALLFTSPPTSLWGRGWFVVALVRQPRLLLSNTHAQWPSEVLPQLKEVNFHNFCNWGLLQSFEVTNFDERHDWLTDPPSPYTANYKWQIWERESFGSHCSVFNIRITHIHRSHDTWSIIFAPYLRTHAVGG